VLAPLGCQVNAAATLRRLVLRLLAPVRSRRADDELTKELAAHLASLEHEFRRRGHPADEAALLARRALGSLESIREQHRDARSLRWLSDAKRDWQYAWRALARTPGFTIVAVLTLGLGIGANTAIFTLIDAVVLRALPVRDPQQLTQLTMRLRTGQVWQSFSYPLALGFAEQHDVFSNVCGFSDATFNVGPPDAVETTSGAWVTGQCYETFGLLAAAGRLLTPEDDRPGAAPVAVLSDSYWRRRFQRDPRVIGDRLLIGRSVVTIVGVSPRGFSGATVGRAADITLAVAVLPQLDPDRAQNLEASSTWLRILARPHVGLSPLEMQSRLRSVWPGVVETAIPDSIAIAKQRALASTVDVIPGATGWSSLRDRFRRPLLVVMAFVGVVLLVACVNVANLLLARTAARGREIAVRLAMGAGRGRIARQLLTESALLASLGCALGLALAQGGCRLLVALIADGQAQPILLDVAPDQRVLWFTAAIALATTVLFGLAPTWQVRSISPIAAILPRIVGRARGRMASSLVVAEIALCLMVLVGAGLLVKTLQNLQTTDPGFRHEGVLLVDVDARRIGHRGPDLIAFYQSLLEEVEGVAGVASASFSSVTPLSGAAISFGIRVEGQPKGEETYFNNVGPRFFKTMRTPVLSGREFTERDDAGAAKVVVVNQAFVRRHLADRPPIGTRLTISRDSELWEIVGVVADAAYETMREAPRPTVYAPYLQRSSGGATFEVAVAGRATLTAGDIRRLVQSRLPGTPIVVRTLTRQFEQNLAQERLLAVLSSTFGALALVLAAVGLYGLLAYSVVQRTGEIGIRMALGARRDQVIRLILTQTCRLTAAGVVCGLAGAAILSGLLKTMLFGVTPLDPSTFGAMTVLFGTVAIVASLLPALRAASVEPFATLRQD